MGRNRNNSSTKIGKKAIDHYETKKVAKSVTKPIKNRMETRGSRRSLSASGESSQEQQAPKLPLPKQRKVESNQVQKKLLDGKKLTRKPKQVNLNDSDQRAEEISHLNAELDKNDEAIVGSANSLIKSIRNRKRRNGSSEEISDDQVQKISKSKQIAVGPSGVNKIRKKNPLHIEDDGIQVGVNSSEDEYNEEGANSESDTLSESVSESYSDDLTSDEMSEVETAYSPVMSSNERENEISFRRGTPARDKREQEPLDRNDPRVRELLDLLLDERKEEKRTSRSSRKRGKTPGSTSRVNSLNSKIKGISLKSPSDTTLYAPALNRTTGNTTGVIRRQVFSKSLISLVDHVPHFADMHRRNSRRKRSSRDDSSSSSSSDRDRSRIRSVSKHRDRDDNDRRSESRKRDSGRLDQAKELANKMVVDAERYKATLIPPKGRSEEQNLVNQDMKDLIAILKSKCDDEGDDEFLHITCHIDDNLRQRISAGEYVELDKLLPKNRSQVMGSNVESTEVIRNGTSYILPALGAKENKISNIRKWEQAFRVYAAIYSEANPHRAAEIWQYVHIINSAASSFIWENVAFYDHTFRQLMHKRPNRSWAKIYNQIWNIAMRDHIPRNFNGSGYNNAQGSGNRYGNQGSQRHGDWRDKCCWRFNKGKCRKWDCKWEHRCSTISCGSYTHGAHQCNKKKQNQQYQTQSNNNIAE